MSKYFEPRNSLWLATVIFSAGSAAHANPTGLGVGAGSASLQNIGSQLDITTSQFAILNWHSFNIQNGETTTFLQPGSSSIVFNVIGNNSPSQIFGNLNANGTVILANANGFYFGPNSMIKVGGSFVATTAPLPNDPSASGPWQFTGMPPLASIVNYGQIQVGAGKSLFLIAEDIENHGSLNAPGGNVDLASGDTVLVSESPDGRGLSASVQLPQGSVDNFGRITADAGTIALQASVVNQNGLIQANSISDNNGIIELVASDQLNLGADSQIVAQGDDSASGSAGGNVTLKSENTFSDANGSEIVTAGGVNGGNGGNIEVSAPNIESLNSAMNAGAAAGSRGGEFLLDPDNIVLGTTGTGSVPPDGTVASGDDPGTLTLNVNNAFANKNFSDILLQATGDITLNSGTTWNLSGSTGGTSGQLSLQAGGDIILGNNSRITDANDWSVALAAGYNFANNTITPGTGNIYINGSAMGTVGGTIMTSAGNINLQAGENILVGSGSVFTTGGGSIFAYAESGNISAGTSNGSNTQNGQTTDYNYNGAGAAPNPYLGGISTAEGGDVTLIAGNNIDSTPKVPVNKPPGASGTYGSGDVTVIAGNQITGNYTLADGTGTMLAGVQVQAAQAATLQQPSANPSVSGTTLSSLETAVQNSQNTGGNIGVAPVTSAGNPIGSTPSTAPVSFSVINGTWNVMASDDISVKEVNNPNGAFNTSDQNLYNYAPDAGANFWAGNAIDLVGANLGRSQNTTPIYAPDLSLNAGAGGIFLNNSIILAPSSEGSLSIVTRDGGDLDGAVIPGSTVLNGITMSDSDSSDYTTFASGHADVPLYLNNPNPVNVDIDGSINSFSLTVPTFANINVKGNTYNFGFQGQNLSASQTTSINVGGSISYRGNLTTIDLTSAELADPLPSTLFTDSADPAITQNLHYDATTGTLIFVGVMSAADLAFLLSPSIIELDKSGNPVTVPVLDSNGNPVLDSNGNPETQPVTIPVTLDASQKALITQLYADTQSASLGDQGLALSGPGNFDVNAGSMDLGVSGGIRVVAPDSAIAAISPYGANLNISTVGDLSMTATKISNESYNGGVNVNVGGTLDVGDQFSTEGDASAPKGIYTTSGGSVSVVANSDVNVDNSRIAAYDGGNVFVESKTGDVNAGTGGAGYVTMTSLLLDPATGQLTDLPATIPGSGILATTLFGSDAALGNITIQAPNGSLNANLGGVLQISFDSANTANNFVDVNVGQNINATGSGIIGSNIKLQAGGSITGVVVGSQNVNINAQQNINVTAVGGVNVTVNSASGTVSGTIIGGGDVSVSGDSITASVLGSQVSASGDTSGASLGIPTANVSKENSEDADNADTASSKTNSGDEDDLKKKKKPISLAQRVSRVTVILPQKN